MAACLVAARRTRSPDLECKLKLPVLEKLASSYGARVHLEAPENVTSARQNIQQSARLGHLVLPCETSLQEFAFRLTRVLQVAGGDLNSEVR